MTSLLQHFEDIAAGNKQIPKRPVVGNLDFLSQSHDLWLFHDLLQKNMGTFYPHYCASIPFILEELCCLGTAICRLAQHRIKDKSDGFTYYEVSAADGTNGRTIAEHSRGLIKTLSDSPNRHNEIDFYKFSRHNYSKFYLGSFVDITPEYLASQSDLHHFKDGFDFIFEQMAFQFYGPERKEQIGYVARLLKEDGLMCFLQKLNQPDVIEYKKREMLKDVQYKSQYFSHEEIEWKRLSMLEDMEQGQVDFDTLVNAIKQYFKYIYLIWNSANFYGFVASNNQSNINKFIELLPTPYIPASFCFEKCLPLQIGDAI
jgi:hypothetical protein